MFCFLSDFCAAFKRDKWSSHMNKGMKYDKYFKVLFCYLYANAIRTAVSYWLPCLAVMVQ